MNIYKNQGMTMKTNNGGSDDDRDDRDNCDDHDYNDATDSNDDDNNDVDDGKNDNEYKCTHARLHIHARVLAVSHTGTFARLYALINIGFYSREGYLRYVLYVYIYIYNTIWGDCRDPCCK